MNARPGFLTHKPVNTRAEMGAYEFLWQQPDALASSGAIAASHESDMRPTPEDLYRELFIDAAVARPEVPPGIIFLFDDLLTAGAHFVAATRRLGELFPGVTVIGNFIARRVFPDPFD